MTNHSYPYICQPFQEQASAAEEHAQQRTRDAPQGSKGLGHTQAAALIGVKVVPTLVKARWIPWFSSKRGLTKGRCELDVS